MDLALGQDVPPLPDYAAGKMFVRISVDQIASIEDFQHVVVHGELSQRDRTRVDPSQGVSL